VLTKQTKLFFIFEIVINKIIEILFEILLSFIQIKIGEKNSQFFNKDMISFSDIVLSICMKSQTKTRENVEKKKKEIKKIRMRKN
jgi:hypothetical protein